MGNWTEELVEEARQAVVDLSYNLVKDAYRL